MPGFVDHASCSSKPTSWKLLALYSIAVRTWQHVQLSGHDSTLYLGSLAGPSQQLLSARDIGSLSGIATLLEPGPQCLHWLSDQLQLQGWNLCNPGQTLLMAQQRLGPHQAQTAPGACTAAAAVAASAAATAMSPLSASMVEQHPHAFQCIRNQPSQPCRLCLVW